MIDDRPKKLTMQKVIVLLNYNILKINTLDEKKWPNCIQQKDA
jgi:hypothetical protein